MYSSSLKHRNTFQIYLRHITGPRIAKNGVLNDRQHEGEDDHNVRVSQRVPLERDAAPQSRKGLRARGEGKLKRISGAQVGRRPGRLWPSWLLVT